MNQETPGGHAISVVNGAAAYAAVVKHLLAHKPFLARIMKECLPKQVIYYCSRMFSAQKNVEFTGSYYDGIQKVYSIWVCSNASEGERSTITA